ncbi:LytR C-terminal domain-containing protein [Nocardioides sp. AE5]|uniref:LytR C-terminal domain-containing protein n=1 Tax=Nocardioides sp. AE5 TaxID=2962573 RepID=UPI0028810128|nr:LytR C-terminal domain-containing protein [Nocardioides sp. AE5]MDT0200880.1 LytR C-terminal domain-containing protein [Nocardioides sp. AE5]
MRTRDESGVAVPSPLVMLSIVAVAMAGITFLVTNGDDDQGKMSTVSQPADDPSADASQAPEAPEESPSAEPTSTPTPEEPVVERGEIFVEIYNRSRINGLAGRTSTKAGDAGWQVVGVDDWQGGNIPSSTVYYPDRLKAEAQLLAKDLGIDRLVPAVDPMKGDRLTVILTADYEG